MIDITRPAAEIHKTVPNIMDILTDKIFIDGDVSRQVTSNYDLMPQPVLQLLQ